jgi:hypothetical protein
VTRRSPRTGESNHEGPRPAGKGLDLGGPGAYHGTTMLVHFRETPYGLAMSLVETHRENGKVRHEHAASLGSIETPPSVAARIEFWRGSRDAMTATKRTRDHSCSACSGRATGSPPKHNATPAGEAGLAFSL